MTENDKQVHQYFISYACPDHGIYGNIDVQMDHRMKATDILIITNDIEERVKRETGIETRVVITFYAELDSD